MSNEHITEEQIAGMAKARGIHDRGAAVDLVRAILALRPAAQPVATNIGSLNTREQIFQNGYRIGFKAGQQTVTAAPAAQPVGEPIKPFFAASIASRKWAELQEQGHRMQHVAFDGGPGGAGVIDPWGKVTWGPTPDRVPMTDEDAKKLLNRSDLLDMFLHIGWYSAPRKNFDQNALLLLRAIEAHHGITTPKADK